MTQTPQTYRPNLTWEFLRTGESKVMAREVWRVRLLPVLTLQLPYPGGVAGVLQERPDSSGKGFQQNNNNNKIQIMEEEMVENNREI